MHWQYLYNKTNTERYKAIMTAEEKKLFDEFKIALDALNLINFEKNIRPYMNKLFWILLLFNIITLGLLAYSIWGL